MPLERPSFSEILERVSSYFRGQFTGSIAAFMHTVEYGYSWAISGATHLLYGRIEWAVRQIFVEKADETWLNLWAGFWLGGRHPAKLASGSVTFTGTDGTVVPADTEVSRSDGEVYTTDALGTVASGSVTVAVTALTAGSAANSEAGTAVSLVSPISGIDSNATVAAGGITLGNDEESKEELIARILSHVQTPSRSGGKGDYVRWAKEADVSVARAWQVGRYPTSGQVLVLVLDEDDAEPSGIEQVTAYIEARRPEGADPTVAAPTVTSINVTITGLTPDTTSVRAAVEAELDDLVTRTAGPNVTLTPSQFIEAISRAEGQQSHTLTAPASPVVSGPSEVFVLGTVTYA